jgi:hypothetical protein
MKFSIKTLLVALVALLLAVPTGALAKGKPSHAGQGNGGGHGKPSWAGKGKGHGAEKGKGHKAKVKAAHENKGKGKKAGAEIEDLDNGETDGDTFSFEDLEGLNPAHYCFALAEELSESFSEMFGTNPNLANAHGKCVSRRAHGEDLTEGLEEEEPAAEEEAESCAPAEEGTQEEGAPEDEALASEEESEGEDTSADECESEEPAEDEPADEESGDESEGDEAEDEEFSFEQLEGLNPAHYCFALAEELSESFSETFGTNPNLANAHGQCVSRRAQGEDLTEGLEEATEEEEEAAEEPAEDEPAEDENGEESEDGESDDESGEGGPAEDQQLTFTFTFEFDFSFLTF